MVSFTQKDEAMQNVKTPKKIARLTSIDTLMWPKALTFGKTQKVEICQIFGDHVLVEFEVNVKNVKLYLIYAEIGVNIWKII